MAQKKDYVIQTSASPETWIAVRIDDTQQDPPRTTDPVMAQRFVKYQEASTAAKAMGAQFPSLTFAVAVLDPLDAVPPMKKPSWFEFGKVVGAAEKADPDLPLHLFDAAVKVALGTGETIKEAADRIKSAILETLTAFEFPYSDEEVKQIRMNLAAAEPIGPKEEQSFDELFGYAVNQLVERCPVLKDPKRIAVIRQDAERSYSPSGSKRLDYLRLRNTVAELATETEAEPA